MSQASATNGASRGRDGTRQSRLDATRVGHLVGSVIQSRIFPESSRLIAFVLVVAAGATFVAPRASAVSFAHVILVGRRPLATHRHFIPSSLQAIVPPVCQCFESPHNFPWR